MLARGLLCRLAADGTKTSTHDLPSVARLLHRSVFARNAPKTRATCAIVRAYTSAVSGNRRTYATSSTSSEAIEKAPKKTATAKAKAPVKKAATKKAPAKKAAATKKKAVAKKPKKVKKTNKAAVRMTKKVLTDEQKAARKAKLMSRKTLGAIRDLKAKALLDAPAHPHPVSAWNVFASESSSTSGGEAVRLSASASASAAKYKDLTPAEKEHYNHLANVQTTKKQDEYSAWVLSRTPEEIRTANQARAKLLQMKKVPGSPKVPMHNALRPIPDERQIKRPLTSYLLFSVDRRRSNDFKGIPVMDTIKLIASEWKALSAAEKKKYEDARAEACEKYEQDYQSTYGHASSAKKAAKAVA